MGAWSVDPWGSDEAADWFAGFFAGCDLRPIQEAFDTFDESDETCYDRIRAACFLLQKLAKPYVWPVDGAGDARELLARGIAILEKMAAPPGPEWSYLALWENDPDVVRSLHAQVGELKDRLAEWA